MHAQETCVDVAVGVANQSVFLAVVLTSILSSFLVDKVGSLGMFIFFFVCSILGAIYLKMFVKDTLKGKYGLLLNEKQKKEIYWPEEYKSEK
jgi:hypothetical protein